jgi:hypothetical protein
MSPRSERDWRLYADDIVSACTKIRRFVAGMTYEAFAADERTQDAVIGTSRLSARPRRTCRTRSSPRRRGRVAQGGRAYAFFRAVPGSRDCAQASDLVAPSGRLCATLTFQSEVAPVRAPDGACVRGAIDQGLDGTVVQQLRSGACIWRFWPRLLAGQ